MAETPFTYDVSTPVGQVRLLLNDIDPDTAVFDDDEITAFLTLEGSVVKRAAAQAIDTNGDNELLASKVLKTQDLATDGSKVQAALHARAEALREQAANEDSWFTLVDPTPPCAPEATERFVPVVDPWWC